MIFEDLASSANQLPEGVIALPEGKPMCFGDPVFVANSDDFIGPYHYKVHIGIPVPFGKQDWLFYPPNPDQVAKADKLGKQIKSLPPISTDPTLILCIDTMVGYLGRWMIDDGISYHPNRRAFQEQPNALSTQVYCDKIIKFSRNAMAPLLGFSSLLESELQKHGITYKNSLGGLGQRCDAEGYNGLDFFDQAIFVKQIDQDIIAVLTDLLRQLKKQPK